MFYILDIHQPAACLGLCCTRSCGTQSSLVVASINEQNIAKSTLTSQRKETTCETTKQGKSCKKNL